MQDLSIGLQELGVRRGDRVAILSENRPEWAIADYACLAARCTDVPIYPTLPAKQAEYILRDSGAVAVAGVDRGAAGEGAKRPRAPARARARHRLRRLRDRRRASSASTQVLARGRAARDRHPDWRAAALEAAPDDLATLIYTSGTTGDPKGVMLTHGNIASNVTTCVDLFSFTAEDECLSFLPLSHIFERMFGHYCMFHAGVVINYAESIDTVPADMQEIRPHLMASVPRLYEKIYARVLDSVRTSSAAPEADLRLGAARWASGGPRRRSRGGRCRRRSGSSARWRTGWSSRSCRARTGGRIRFFVSGGAPLSPEIARFFYAAGLPILEGYGLTETSPVIAVNTFQHHRLGTVGKADPGRRDPDRARTARS